VQALLKKGVERGDFWRDQDGLFYRRSNKRRRTQTFSEEKDLSNVSLVDGPDTYLSLAADLKSEALSWTHLGASHTCPTLGSSSSSSSSSQSSKSVDPNVMRALQDSFDAVTRLTLAVKRTGQELMSAAAITATGEHMVAEGIKLCKGLVAPTQTLEDLLLKPKERISHMDAMNALQAAAKPFEQLEAFNKELIALHKMYVKKPAIVS
jgi:hypothetical protein